MIMIKCHEDVFFSNSMYAMLSGLFLHHLNEIEKEILRVVDFKVHVPNEKYEHYEDRLNNLWQNYQGNLPQWFAGSTIFEFAKQ